MLTCPCAGQQAAVSHATLLGISVEWGSLWDGSLLGVPSIVLDVPVPLCDLKPYTVNIVADMRSHMNYKSNLEGIYIAYGSKLETSGQICDMIIKHMSRTFVTRVVSVLLSR